MSNDITCISDSKVLDPDAGGFDYLGSHLTELRRRLIICVAISIPLFGIGMYLYRSLWDVVTHPLRLSAPHLLRFQALAPSDGLLMSMRISFGFALVLSLPVWTAQIWGFISPGLNGKERRWLYISLGGGSLLFFAGVTLAYFIGIPLGLEFLLPFNLTLANWENSFTGPDFVDFVMTCCIGFGIAFELPLLMLILGWINLITPAGLKEWWRVVTIAIVVMAAVFTPPDPFTQALLAVPMIILFWLGYGLVWWVQL